MSLHDVDATLPSVMAGLDPAIQKLSCVERARFVRRVSRLDGRIKSGHDGQRVSKPAFDLKLAPIGHDEAAALVIAPWPLPARRL